jgi:hypothetical protein
MHEDVILGVQEHVDVQSGSNMLHLCRRTCRCRLILPIAAESGLFQMRFAWVGSKLCKFGSGPGWVICNACTVGTS